ncbi:carbon storage regulator CsrA [Pseudomonas graminis]
MLVLSRAIGEVISIGDDIALHILEVNGSQVKFGVDAPAGVRVHRTEIYEKILQRQGPTRHPVAVPNP